MTESIFLFLTPVCYKPGNLRGCRSYPVLAYDFAEFLNGDGAIQIKQ